MALSIALIAILVLFIVAASVAWFTSNPHVGANDVLLGSARTLTVSFGAMNEDLGYRYNGQIGNVPAPVEEDPDSDAPYVYETGGFTMSLTSFSSGNKRGKVTLEFGTVEITYPTGSISNVLITDLFHITVDAYVRNNSGTYVKDESTQKFRAYVAATDGGLVRYEAAFTDLTVAEDGTLMKTVSGTPSVADFGEGVYEFTFSYTFLPEAAFAVWENASAASPTASFDDICGYELAAGGDYIGVVDYVAYKAKYHYGLRRYVKSATPDGNGNYIYSESDNGNYVRVVSSYRDSGVTLYRAIEDPVTHEITYSDSGEGRFNYIKVGDSRDYIAVNRYNLINGFPYSNDKYRGETFTFAVCCTVEEMEVTL